MKKDFLKKQVSLKELSGKRPAALGKVVRLRVSNRLWPIAAVLALAVVAVPILLSSSSSASNTPIAQAPQSPAIPSISGIPAVNVTDSDTPSRAKLKGKSHNPFKQLGAGSSSKSSKSTTKPEPTPSQTPSGSSSKSGSTSPSGGNGTGTGTGSGHGTTTTTTTTPAPPPPPTTLAPTESYDVAVSITGSSGDENTISSLERLSALPSRNNPLLVELGVLQGGKRVLFAVQPGTVGRGGGRCIPGPVDCEILSLAPHQVEKLEAATQDGVMPEALFAVTGITMQQHQTAAAADSARRVQSAFGHSLLRQSTGTALSLFPYEPSLGALVDQRNLSVGGGDN
jgi:hypothetical protein